MNILAFVSVSAIESLKVRMVTFSVAFKTHDNCDHAPHSAHKEMSINRNFNIFSDHK